MWLFLVRYLTAYVSIAMARFRAVINMAREKGVSALFLEQAFAIEQTDPPVILYCSNLMQQMVTVASYSDCCAFNQQPFNTPSIPLQYPFNPPSIPLQYPFNTPSIPLQYPFNTPSIPLQYPFNTPSIPL